MVTMRVLVVEDEKLLADAVATGLRRHAMAVDVRTTARVPSSGRRSTTTTW